MLGGTRILDYGAYENAYSYLRGAGQITLTPDTRLIASCLSDYSGAASNIDICSYGKASPVGQPVASAPMLDRAELPKQHMPLQYHVEGVQSERLEVALTPLASRGLDPWTPEVPNPPPKFLIAVS
jgi:hypothetical protein